MSSLKLSPSDRKALYAARRFLDSGVERKLGLQMPFDVYFQDPLVAEEDPDLAFDEAILDWEPGLADGPTSARFAVVDYNGDTDTLAPPARWDPKRLAFVLEDRVLDRGATESLQYHQLHVWAVLQRALRFFEEPFGLGRPVPWGFDGNRLIVVPHAGYGRNAFYDRRSKSLQFYYFDRAGRRTHTCLSTDIVHHEMAHAVLDGVRPLLIESAVIETAAFHEFVGDLTAILILLRNTAFRSKLARRTGGDLSAAENVASIAEEFGREVTDKPYLRSAANCKTMADVAGSRSPHEVCQVLVGAMFDIVLALSKHYVEERGRTPAQAFWDTIQRMQRMAIQPLDLLPPVDVTFRDYALAVLRAEELSNPRDPYGYCELMLGVFVARGILGADEATDLSGEGYLHDRLRLGVFHEVERLASSRAAAYRFLDDNRKELLLPTDRDVVVADLYRAQKLTRQAGRLPRQTVLEYVWREDVPLAERRFARLQARSASLVCGGTLVFDDDGNVVWWSRKPGTAVAGDRGEAAAEAERGAARRQLFLDDLGRRAEEGQIGRAHGGERGFVDTRMPPFVTRIVDGSLRVELSPHLGLADDHENDAGDRRWEISS